MVLFVLVHSPAVGPATWSPVARRLAAAGRDAVVPSLLPVADGGPPFWPRVAEAVTAALEGTDPGQPLVLVAHSGAGVFVPVIERALARPVACSIFADARLPAAGGVTPAAEEPFLAFLTGLAGPDGRLPRWTDWWDEDDVAALFPGPRAREVITGEQPRLPLAYFREQVPAPPGWDAHPCGYLLFSPAYEEEAADARRRGWPVRSVPGGHLHQVADPHGVTRALLALAASPPRRPLPGPGVEGIVIPQRGGASRVVELRTAGEIQAMRAAGPVVARPPLDNNTDGIRISSV
jgi:hypothetical protein